jgi:signal transduction histidine kinase/HD-GYP domain-containing protein (c-di-GMP phosphodiesterase class II)
MTVLAGGSPRGTDLPHPGLGALAEAVLALRRTSEVGTACTIACDSIARVLGPVSLRLLRVDSRSGALRRIEEGDAETAYPPEPGGPVEWVLRHETALYDGGVANVGGGAAAGMHDGEPLLWSTSPAALAALPLFSGSTLQGVLVAGFEAPRAFEPGDRLVLQTLADVLALALERADLRRDLDHESARRMQLERRIDVDEEASSNLMSLVAHEIRTPLTAIKAYAETLLASLQHPGTPRERFLGIINEECDRLGRLATDVLELSRLEAGQRPLRLARFDLHTMVAEAIAPLEGVARMRRVTLVGEVAPDLAIEADRDLLRRAVSHLIVNAVQVSPPGSVVRVTATADDEAWTLSVEDRGGAIPPGELPRLFERLHPARRADGTPAEGAGIGLAITRGIAALHGGRVWAESPAADGACIHLRLPLRQLASARARAIAHSIAGRSDLRRLFDESVTMVAATMDAGIVSLMLVDPERGDLYIAASRGLEDQNLAVRRTAVRAGVAGTVAAWARPMLVGNIETDRRFQRLNHPQYSTKSLLSVPLLVEGEVLGVVNVNNKASREPFDEHDLAVLVALVERVGSAVERAYAHPDNPYTVEQAIDAVRSVSRLREEGLLGSRDLVRRARRLAREVGMPDADVDRVGYVAAIHDVGMAPLHRRLASIHGPLDDADRRALARHPETSVEILRPIEYLARVRDMVLAHHEHWNGNGYPHGLAGEQIPAGARVLAVVDAFESMVAGRPYRPARSRMEALAELRRCAGGQFDPEVVEAFARVLEHETSPS